MDGKFIDWDNAKMHIIIHALHYGMAVFDDIRYYNTKIQLPIFRLDELTKILIISCKIYYMSLEYSAKEIKQAILKL